MVINYQKRWGKDGTCYRQTIKIDKWLMEKYNNYLLELKEDAEKKYQQKRCYTSYQLEIKSLSFLEVGVNYTNLIHLEVFTHLLDKLYNEGYDLKNDRIMLCRNTILEVIL